MSGTEGWKISIDAFPFAQGAICFEGARIGGESSLGPNCVGLTKMDHDHDVGAGFREAHEGEMAVVQVAHGGHEGEALARTRGARGRFAAFQKRRR
jgi:hypothetical protein